jgi:hypothetical protein
VAERLAGMAAPIEAELFLQRRELAPQHRHVLDRRVQRLARPKPGMNADAGHLAALADRHHDQIERHPAVHGGAAVRLGHQRFGAAILEVAHRALATARVRRLAGNAEDAERFARRFAGPLDMEAEQGHRTVREPAQQAGMLGVEDLVGIGPHPRLHRLPIADGRAHVAEDAMEFQFEFPATPRVEPVGLQIHDGFELAVLAPGRDRSQAAGLVTLHGQDRVQQAMDDQVVAGESIGDGIHQEGHVVVDDPDPHAAVTDRAAERLKLDIRHVGCAAPAKLADETRGLLPLLVAEVADFAGKGPLDQRFAQGMEIRQGSGPGRHHAVRVHHLGSRRGAARERRRIVWPGL